MDRLTHKQILLSECKQIHFDEMTVSDLNLMIKAYTETKLFNKKWRNAINKLGADVMKLARNGDKHAS